VRAALGFLTVLGGAAAPDRTALRWFPVVGAIVGALLGLVWWGADEVWPPIVVAALVIAADLVLTGLLHVDGLADSADGLLPPLVDRDRRLAVMADPVTGAFGVATVAAVLLLRFAGLAGADIEPLALVAIWTTSRTLAALVAVSLPYVRQGGLASGFLDGPEPVTSFVLVVGLALAVPSAIVAGLPGVVAVAATVGAFGLVIALGRARLGGFTGDVLGAAIVVGETGGLLALAARW
jgi:adenosylcobinamide-GDP ribazoletransferase